MEIKLYSTDSNANVLNKNLTLVNTIDGIITDYEQNYDNIRLNLHTNDNFNYIFIPSYHKYYFVDNVEMAENGMNFYECRCDLLMSFSDVVKNSIIKLRGEHQRIFLLFSIVYRIMIRHYNRGFYGYRNN